MGEPKDNIIRPAQMREVYEQPMDEKTMMQRFFFGFDSDSDDNQSESDDEIVPDSQPQNPMNVDHNHNQLNSTVSKANPVSSPPVLMDKLVQFELNSNATVQEPTLTRSPSTVISISQNLIEKEKVSATMLPPPQLSTTPSNNRKTKANNLPNDGSKPAKVTKLNHLPAAKKPVQNQLLDQLIMISAKNQTQSPRTYVEFIEMILSWTPTEVALPDRAPCQLAQLPDLSGKLDYSNIAQFQQCHSLILMCCAFYSLQNALQSSSATNPNERTIDENRLDCGDFESCSGSIGIDLAYVANQKIDIERRTFDLRIGIVQKLPFNHRWSIGQICLVSLVQPPKSGSGERYQINSALAHFGVIVQSRVRELNLSSTGEMRLASMVNNTSTFNSTWSQTHLCQELQIRLPFECDMHFRRNNILLHLKYLTNLRPLLVQAEAVLELEMASLETFAIKGFTSLANPKLIQESIGFCLQQLPIASGRFSKTFASQVDDLNKVGMNRSSTDHDLYRCMQMIGDRCCTSSQIELIRFANKIVQNSSQNVLFVRHKANIELLYQSINLLVEQHLDWHWKADRRPLLLIMQDVPALLESLFVFNQRNWTVLGERDWRSTIWAHAIELAKSDICELTKQNSYRIEQIRQLNESCHFAKIKDDATLPPFVTSFLIPNDPDDLTSQKLTSLQRVIDDTTRSLSHLNQATIILHRWIGKVQAISSLRNTTKSSDKANQSQLSPSSTLLDPRLAMSESSESFGVVGTNSTANTISSTLMLLIQELIRRVSFQLLKDSPVVIIHRNLLKHADTLEILTNSKRSATVDQCSQARNQFTMCISDNGSAYTEPEILALQKVVCNKLVLCCNIPSTETLGGEFSNLQMEAILREKRLETSFMKRCLLGNRLSNWILLE